MNDITLAGALIVRPATSETCAALRRAGARQLATGDAVTIRPDQPDIPARWILYELAGERIAVILERIAAPATLDNNDTVTYTYSKQAE